MLILHRPRFAFKSSNRGVVVERDHKAVACGARPLQKFDMTRVEKVEAPVRQSHFQAFGLPIGDNCSSDPLPTIFGSSPVLTPPTGFTQAICRGRLHNRRAWRRGVPAAEAGGDPCEPREGAVRVWVLLPHCFSFQGAADGGGGFDRAFVDHVGCGAGARVPGVGELKDSRRRDHGEGSEVEQAPRALDLGLFQSQAVAFKHAEDLFDAPAQTIEANDFPSVLGGLNRQGRQKPPHQRRGPQRNVPFARHNDVDLAGFGIAGGQSGLGSGDCRLAERNGHAGRSNARIRRARLAWGGRHIDLERRRKTVGCRKQEAGFGRERDAAGRGVDRIRSRIPGGRSA